MTYADVRDDFLPGDLLACSGKGRVSGVIKRFTRSQVSHVGIVRHTKILTDDKDRYFNEVIESTSLDGFLGVVVSRISKRLESYEGTVWWLPLDDAARERFNERLFFDFLYQQEGKPYDTPGAIRAGLDWLDSIGLTLAREDFSKLFCSELAAGALEAAGVLINVNASEETPIQLCNRPIWKEPVRLVGSETWGESS